MQRSADDATRAPISRVSRADGRRTVQETFEAANYRIRERYLGEGSGSKMMRAFTQRFRLLSSGSHSGLDHA